MRRVHRASGFTLLEMLLVVAVMALALGTILPISSSLFARNNLAVAQSQTVSALRRAQTLSQAMDGDASWGVRVATGTVTVFKGLTYATREIISDDTLTISSGVTATGLTEVTFAKLSGLPSASGTLVFTGFNSETRSIGMNLMGTVSY